MANAEKLAVSMSSRQVGYGHFGHRNPGKLKFPYHFDAESTVVGFQRNNIEDASAKETKIAIHIPDRKIENHAHRAAIHLTNPDAVPGV